MRLLPQSSGEISRTLMENSEFQQTHLEDWSILTAREDQLSLEPARGDARISVEGGILRLEHPHGALVRLLELPPNRFLRLEVDLVPAGPFELQTGCDRFFMIGLDRLAQAESVADLMLRGIPVSDAEDPILLEQFLASEIEVQRKRPQQQWVRPVDRSGFASASLRFATGDEREAWALVAPASEQAASIRSFVLSDRPDRSSQLLQVDGGADPTAPVKLFGVRYHSALVRPGETLVLKQAIPAGAETISYQLGLDPKAAPGATARWTLEVEVASEQFLELSKGSLTRKERAPAVFQEQADLWPKDLDLPAPEVRFRVEGQAGIYVGQPMVRGPKSEGLPNLLLISIDTLRADHLGCYGYQRPTSPFLDGLAEQSALFLNFRGVAPFTLPAHATLFTGLMPIRHGAVGNFDRLDASQVAYLPQILAEAGFVTAAFTSGGFLSHEFGFFSGFDRYGMVDPIHPDDDDRAGSALGFRMLRKRHDLGAALRWVAAHQQERWFLFLHTFLVHEYEAPEEDLGLFRTVPEGVLDQRPARYLQAEDWVGQQLSAETVEYLRNRYDGTIHYADRALANFFRNLEDQELLNDTVVVITSDHGEEFGDHGGLIHSATLYEEMLRVPLLIRLPKGGSQQVIREAVSQADLTPTLLDLLGLSPLDQVDGHSRASLVRGGPPSAGATPVYAQVDSVVSSRSSLQVGSLKIIRGDLSTVLEQPAPAAWQLFDLEHDPREQKDIADERPDRLEQMKERLRRYEAYLKERAILGNRADVGPELLRQLEELGY